MTDNERRAETNRAITLLEETKSLSLPSPARRAKLRDARHIIEDLEREVVATQESENRKLDALFDATAPDRQSSPNS